MEYCTRTCNQNEVDNDKTINFLANGRFPAFLNDKENWKIIVFHFTPTVMRLL